MIAAMKAVFFVLLGSVLLAAATVGTPAAAGDGEQAGRHGFAILGELKYPPDFTHFDYVNPDAPKGGSVRLNYHGSYDSLNPFILKGVAAAGNNPFGAGGSVLGFQPLMVAAGDEPDSFYGLTAESVAFSDDRRAVTFTIRETAKWHDGSEVTAEDVAFSFDTLKSEGRPIYRVLYRDILEAKVVGPRRVRFVFRDGVNVRDLPGYVAGMPVLSKAYYTRNAFNETTLEPPMASGVYRVAKVDAGRSITYERIEGHWAENLPVYRGRFNFDTIRFDYYKDREVELEAFFAGKIDFREEFTSKSWATKYDVPPVRDGRIKRAVLPDQSPSGTQAFFLNSRRAKFADPRVRRALAYAFDFEWSNKTLFYGLYDRSTSIFENSELSADGPPTPAELALLEPFRDRLPPEVFEAAYRPPVTDGSGRIRRHLRTATDLLAEAGWTVRDGRLVNAAGEGMNIEFLSYNRGFERIVLPYVRNLERLGITASFRLVEPAQYQNRLRTFDYDTTTFRFGGSLTPGVSLRNLWGSAAADVQGSQNFTGIKDPVVDALIEKVIAARDRDALIAATRALDRVVMWGHYLVPQWYKGAHHVAYWDMFGFPETKPNYDLTTFNLGFFDTWWVDPDKAVRR